MVRTYAPIGQTPILHEHLSREHLSAISAINLEGKLYMHEQDRALRGPDVVRFLRHLLRWIAGAAQIRVNKKGVKPPEPAAYERRTNRSLASANFREFAT